jgi:hypothetical protein
MVNKYKHPGLISLYGVENWIYNPISGMYHAGEVAVSPKFIKNWNNGTQGNFEPVPEVKVETSYQGNGDYRVYITMPPNQLPTEEYLQEIIYNALNSQK